MSGSTESQERVQRETRLGPDRVRKGSRESQGWVQIVRKGSRENHERVH